MTLTRREFFKVAALGSGGLVVALNTKACARPRRLNEAAVAKEHPAFAANAWVRLLADNTVIFVVDKSEMGQGVMTALPMLIAEELDVDWSRIEIEQAPAKPVYVNPALGQEATGGSSSVSSSYTPLRRAGATVRRMLLLAAEARSHIAIRRLRTHKGFVVLPDGRRLAYGLLAAAAAKLPVPSPVTLKRPSAFTVIGRSLPRLDTPAKTVGRALFGIDVRLPGLLTAAVQHSPIIGGSLRHYDEAAAMEIAGVVRIVTLASGIGVIATDTWTAEKGLKALGCTWYPGPHRDLSSATIRQDSIDAARGDGRVAESRGSARELIKTARRTVRADYEIPYAAHVTLEPMNCTVHFHDGLCEIWVPTQSQTGVQMTAERLTRLPRQKIVVHTTFLGGGFGRRFEQDFVEDAVTMAMSVDHPVKVLWSRTQDMTHDFYRPYSYHTLWGALDQNGHPIAWRQKIVAASIMRRVDPGAIRRGIDPTAVQGATHMAYDIGHIEIDYIEQDAPVPVGFWRSVGNSYTAFAKETFIDELAHAGGHDPLVLRRHLLRRHKRALRVLNAAAHAAGWGLPLGPRRGRGIAIHPSFGGYTAQVAEVTLTPRGLRVDRVVCACDCGLVVNPNIVRAQLEGAIVFGLTAALKGPITVDQGRIQQTNIDSYPLWRMDEMPTIEIHLIASARPPTGAGEPGVPPLAPAVGNAIFAASGIRHRVLPFPIGT